MNRKCHVFILFFFILLSLCFPVKGYAEKAASYSTALTMSSGLSTQLNKMRVQDAKFNIVINGIAQQEIEKLSYVRNGSLMLPLREVCSVFGLQTRWNAGTRTIEITDNNITAKAKAGSYLYSIGSMGPVKLNMYTEIKNAKSYVPVDFFSEILNASLSIDKSTLNIDFKYANINSVLKIHSIAEAYIDTLQKKGYSDISFNVIYTGEQIGSVLYKANYKNFGSADKDLIPLVFNIKNGNPMPLSMIIKPKDVSGFRNLLSEKYNISSFDLKEDANYYIMKFYSQVYLIIVQKDNSNNYSGTWIPLNEIENYLQIS